MDKSIGKFIVKTVAKMVLLAFVISAFSFFLLIKSPINPVASYVGSDNSISAEQREEIAEYWGVNDPPMERYGNWLKAICHGDFGMSSIYRRPVIEVIKERFVISFPLMLTAWILSGIVAVFLGVISAIKRGSMIDKIVKGYCLFLSSSPAFWIAILLLMFFSVWLGILPIGLAAPLGKLAEHVTLGERIQHLILPVIALSITGISNLALQVREKMIMILESDYVVFAQARGESTWEIIKQHCMRNIMLPIVTLQFGSLGELFGGSVLVETIFSYPGIGSTTTAAGLKGDMALILGISVISVLFIFSGNLIANLLYPVLDPKIRNEVGGLKKGKIKGDVV